jgi:hypothetical protein
MRRPSRERTLGPSVPSTMFSHVWSSVPNNLAVDSAADAVLQLEVHLGHSVFG